MFLPVALAILSQANAQALDPTLAYTAWGTFAVGAGLTLVYEPESPNFPSATAPAFDTKIRSHFARDEPVGEFESFASFAIFPWMAAPFALQMLNGDNTTALINTLNSYLLTVGLTQVVKKSVARERPDGSDHQSFFSGHSASAFVAGAGVVSALQDAEANPWLTHTVWVISGALAASRIVDDKHFTSDVITGAAVGAAVGLYYQRHGMTDSTTALHISSSEQVPLAISISGDL
jgi:membrane-associated phospholipid phosphatase